MGKGGKKKGKKEFAISLSPLFTAEHAEIALWSGGSAYSIGSNYSKDKIQKKFFASPFDSSLRSLRLIFYWNTLVL